MFKAVLCTAHVHAPEMKHSGDEYSVYLYVCQRGCGWTSRYWNESETPVSLPWPMRLARNWAPSLLRP